MSIKNKVNCYISSSSEDLPVARQISDFLSKDGIEVVTWNKTILHGMTALENTQSSILKADFVIAIIPPGGINSQHRQNLFFELGIIVGMGKPLLTLVRADSHTDLPSDLSSIMYLKYEPNDLHQSLRYIRNWATHSLNR